MSLRVLFSWLVMATWSSVKVALREVKRRESEDKEDALEDFFASIRNNYVTR